MIHAASRCLLLLWLAASGGPPAAGTMTAAEAEALARELTPRVEELRGLKFKRPVPVKVVDDATAQAHFKARIDKFWPPARVRLEEKVYVHLGLLPAGLDLVRTLLDTLEEQAGGFYDPEQDTFFVLSDIPRKLASIVMVHELTHALDDQHYGIDELLDKSRQDSDREAALSAVIEGSGTLVMAVHMLREVQAGRLGLSALQEMQQSEAGRAEKLKQAPQILQRQLIASYILGQSFLLRGNLTGLLTGIKQADLDRAFRDPPLSLEQVLHPEKYWDEARKDLPRPVPLPDLSPALGQGWSLAAKGTMGELELALIAGAGPLNLQSMEAALPDKWTSEAARGWGGDLYQHYISRERSLTVLGTLWDSEKDAAEFEAALKVPSGSRVRRRADAVVVVAGEGGAAVKEMLAGRALDALVPAAAKAR